MSIEAARKKLQQEIEQLRERHASLERQYDIQAASLKEEKKIAASLRVIFIFKKKDFIDHSSDFIESFISTRIGYRKETHIPFFMLMIVQCHAAVVQHQV